MRKRLIINADDYGRTSGISNGIRIANNKGVVSSTSCMMNMPTIENDLALALNECPSLGIGVHLNLTSGKPLIRKDISSLLVNDQGVFYGLGGFLKRLPGLALDAVELEWQAQVERFIGITGRKPTHLDSHHHSSYFTPALFSLMLKLAEEYSCAIRFPMMGGRVVEGLPEELVSKAEIFLPELCRTSLFRCPDGFYTTFYDEGISLNQMVSIMDSMNEGTYEIMTHPGLVDASLDSTYNRQREKELAVLIDPHLGEKIIELGIGLIHFGDI